MRSITFAVGLIAVSCAVHSFAVEPPTVPDAGDFVPRPVRAGQNVKSVGNAVVEPWRELKLAADHLERAGFPAQADAVRKQAEELRADKTRVAFDRVPFPRITDKKANQVAQPEKIGPQILLKFRLLELDVTKLNQLGLKDQDLKNLSSNDEQRLIALLDGLQENRLIKVLAEPKLTTLVGREVQFEVGQMIATTHRGRDEKPLVEPKHVGVRLSAIPKLTAPDRIGIDFEFEHSQLQSTQATDDPQLVEPNVKITRITTSCEVSNGKSRLIALPIGTKLADLQEPGNNGTSGPAGKVKIRTQLFFVVTPQIVNRSPAR